MRDYLAEEIALDYSDAIFTHGRHFAASAFSG